MDTFANSNDSFKTVKTGRLRRYDGRLRASTVSLVARNQHRAGEISDRLPIGQRHSKPAWMA